VFKNRRLTITADRTTPLYETIAEAPRTPVSSTACRARSIGKRADNYTCLLHTF